MEPTEAFLGLASSCVAICHTTASSID